VSESTLTQFSKEEIISHCLFDMTFHGFSETDLIKVKHDLDLQLKDMDDPVRFVIVSRISMKLKWQLFFNIADETWCSEINSATIFKREKYARAICEILNEGKEDRNIIARITTKDNKRKVLKYMK
jgi:hypothetical protein